mgnify:FL=1|tara:strand:+ start:1403 stop:2149 length:747 start_codon:yes stop_codon:yes gene_type:complete
MAEYTEEEQSFLDTLPESTPTEEDFESAEEKAIELAGRDFQQDEDGTPSTFFSELDQYRQDAFQRTLDAREGARQRRDAGLEDEGLFEIATELSGVARGEIESEDRRRTRESIEALASGQRGLAQSGTGLRSAARLRGGETAAQAVELIGGAKLSEATELEREAAAGQLRDLLIQGRTRAENKKLRMQEIAYQREQARKGLFGDILSGVLGAIGAGIAFAIPGAGPAAVALGAAVMGGTGKAVGRRFG